MGLLAIHHVKAFYYYFNNNSDNKTSRFKFKYEKKEKKNSKTTLDAIISLILSTFYVCFMLRKYYARIWTMLDNNNNNNNNNNNSTLVSELLGLQH